MKWRRDVTNESNIVADNVIYQFEKGSTAACTIDVLPSCSVAVYAEMTGVGLHFI